MIFGCLPLLLIVLASLFLKTYEFTQANLESFSSQLKTRGIFLGSGHIMSLIEYQKRILESYFVGLTDFLIDQVVIGHENNVGRICSILRCVVGTEHMHGRLFMKFFHIEGLPGHLFTPFVSITVVDAGIYTLLGGRACSIQLIASVLVYVGVNAEMVSRRYKNCSWLKSCVFELFLHLS